MTLVDGIGDEVIYAVVIGTITTVLFFAWRSTQVRDLPSRARLVVTALRTVDGRPQPVFQISRTINIDLPPGLLNGEAQSEGNEISSPETPVSDNLPETTEEQSATDATEQESEAVTEASAGEETDASMNAEPEISVKVIFLNDTQKIVKAQKRAKVGEFKRLNFPEASDRTKVVRLVFNGQVLSDDSRTLEEYGVFDNCALHCLIHPNRSSQQRQNGGESASASQSVVGVNVPDHLLHAQQAGARRFTGMGQGGTIVAEFELDFGSLLIPLCALILGLFWYWRFIYNELFNSEATVSLVGLTTLFTGFMFVMYLPIRGAEE